ncbi:polyphosphate kinase 2 family protein [bacterium]|nr:polyphosphate kinase 2 family protein [bacterium]
MKIKLDPDQDIRIKVGDGKPLEFKLRKIFVPPGERVSLKKDFDPAFTGGLKDKQDAREHVEANQERLADLQEKLYAQDTYALLVIFQAMDAAGKDGAIQHVMSGVNPQGCLVTSFKAPSAEELDHDYLWRASKALPGRGMIGIFNRSYYEEVLVVRVHEAILQAQKLPPETVNEKIWERRYRQINAFERHLVENGTVILKFFLNVSFKEQRKRFLDRIEEPSKNWKFSVADYKERGYWKDYQRAYEECISNTSTEYAPWFVIPADTKWFTRLCVSEMIVRAMKRLDLKFPEVSAERRAELQKIKSLLEKE